METSAILSADVLDIIFEGKNKSYGAYDLRKSYRRRLALSITGMLGLILLFVTGFLFASNHRSETPPKNILPLDVQITDLGKMKPVELPPLPKPVKPAVSNPIPIKTLKDLVPKIVPDHKYKPEDQVPENKDLENTAIGSSNEDGKAAQGGVAPPAGQASGTGTDVVEPPVKKGDGDGRFEKVEIESFYPGGVPAWQRFLNRTFRYPQDAADIGICGTVVVEFIVDVDGAVSNVRAISGPDELRAEAERVIRKSGKWEPAIQNGRKVKSFKKQPIRFEMVQE